MPSGTIKHYELLNLKVAKQPNWIFSSLLSLNGLVQSCMTPSQSLLDETAAFYAEQSTTPLLFTTSVLWGAWYHPPKNYGFIYDVILFICTHAHKVLSNRT